MIRQKEIRDKAMEWGVPPDTADKDYVLGHFLAGFHDYYNEELILKGGTCLRKCWFPGYRFSEDLDFDCNDLSENEFATMADDVQRFLQRSGFNVESRNRENARLTAFRRNLYFPELLFNMGLTGHRNARFLLKLEAQDQKVDYETATEFIKGCGFFFPFPVPTDAVLCAMKIAAMLARNKGRDYYDVMFLMAQTEPDYAFLTNRCGIRNKEELKSAVHESLQSVDLRQKQRDFEHLLFHRANSRKILYFADFMHTV